MTETVKKPFRSEFTVQYYQADFTGTASIVSICDFLQEAADSQAASIGMSLEHMMERGLTWVLTRLRVEMDARIYKKDRISVQTWPAALDRLYAYRDFLIFDKNGGQIGRATSNWVLIDLEKRAPVRMNGHVEELYREHYKTAPPRALVMDRVRPVRPEGETLCCPARWRVSDLDTNSHINNTSIIELTLESAGLAAWENRVPMMLDIEFKAESRYGDELLSETSFTDNGGIVTGAHRLVRISDGKEISVARTAWEAR